MTENNATQNQSMLRILRLVYKCTTESSYAPHIINQYLGFGFKKEDLRLESLKDTRLNVITMNRVAYWARKKLLPFINHGESFSKRNINNVNIEILIKYMENIFENYDEDLVHDASNFPTINTDEFKILILFFALFFLNSKRKDRHISIDDYEEGNNFWEHKLSEFKKNSQTSNLSNAIVSILGECEQIIRQPIK